MGLISKKWSGTAERSVVTSESDRFGVDFPDEVESTEKAILLATTFLIDYLYFEFDEGGTSDLQED